MLQENRSVKKLVLYSCNIEKAGATALAHALRVSARTLNPDPGTLDLGARILSVPPLNPKP